MVLAIPKHLMPQLILGLALFYVLKLSDKAIREASY